MQINTFGYGNYSSPYSNRYNSYSSVSVEQTYRGIGYTTNYSNGQFNSTHYYQSTYTQSASSSGGRPGQPRRVIIKHGNDSIDTKRDDDWNPNWKYYHGSVLGIGYDERWYYKDGDDMYFWNGNEWEHTGRWDWVHTHESATAHHSVPIGDPDFYLITALLFSYFIYIYMKKRRQQFLLYTGIKR